MSSKQKQMIFTADPWCLKMQQPRPQYQMLLETLFAQANGYIGSRGSYEEALSSEIPSCEGVYLNGVYQQEPIVYGEKAYGYASHNQKMLQVPNGKRLTLTLDNEILRAFAANTNGQCEFDLQSGVYSRKQQWSTEAGKKLTLKSRRFVSLANQHLMAIEYQITAENFSGAIKLTSALDANYQFNINSDDPRIGQLSIDDSLTVLQTRQLPQSNGLVHQVCGTDFIVASATLDILPSTAKLLTMSKEEKYLSHDYQLMLNQGETITIYKWIGYSHYQAKQIEAKERLLSDLQLVLENAAIAGFTKELQQHRQHLNAFWQSSDIVIEGDPRLQQGIRFNLFQLYQSAGRNGRANIGAKGLTGHGYDGHYFWDTEIYVIPSLCFSQPEIARKLIEFRINTLPQARQRAREMSHETGALFPWRTIGGEECSAYYPAGTAQYHINAAVAYALKCYLNATDDQQILWDGGAEMLFETARLWLQLGHFNSRCAAKFCIDAVTGPDEYTAIVNNNFYTNAMAQMHLRFAGEVANLLAISAKKEFEKLASRINLTTDEINLWHQAAERMYLPYDEKLGIHLQDDSFLNKAVWDFANTPKEKYPLLLHFHPLVIYRYQVLKQADVVLAMFLLDEQFNIEQKKRNLAYYEPLTTHDSSLSSCIHSIEYAETGEYGKAYEFFENTVRMDLDNNHGNSEYGVHIACMAGSWASIVHGFAGFRARKEGLFFKPYLPNQWQSYNFRLRYRGQQILVIVSRQGICYQLLQGTYLVLNHFDQQILLTSNNLIQSISWQSSNQHNHCLEELL